METKIFVYGTLMKGFVNYKKYLQGNVISVERAKTKGKLYHMENKGYPALNKGDDDVYGEVITLKSDSIIMENIDKLEQCHEKYKNENEYNKEVMKIKVGERSYELNTYMYNFENPNSKNNEFIHIPSGDWKKYMLGSLK